MMKNQQSNIVAIDINTVKSRILQVRGQQVLLDRDVAALYGVETRIINQAVKNNPEKFPAGYVAELSSDELATLRSKFLTANVSSKSRALPKVFTERGLYMLATILKGERAERGAEQSSCNAAFETNRGMIKWNAMIVVGQKSLSDSGGDDSLPSVRTKVRKGWCKIIKTIAVLMAGMVLTTGTAAAAPHHGWHRPHCPPPPPRHHVVHHVHHGGNAGWVALGAAALGAVVGGLIGAAAN